MVDQHQHEAPRPNGIEVHKPKKARKSHTRNTVPSKPIAEQAKRLGISTKALCDEIGISDSYWHNSLRQGQVTKTIALAVEALVRRQSRNSTGWGIIKTHNGVIEVTPLLEAPEEVRLNGKSFYLVAKP